MIFSCPPKKQFEIPKVLPTISSVIDKNGNDVFFDNCFYTFEQSSSMLQPSDRAMFENAVETYKNTYYKDGHDLIYLFWIDYETMLRNNPDMDSGVLDFQIPTEQDAIVLAYNAEGWRETDFFLDEPFLFFSAYEDQIIAIISK